MACRLDTFFILSLSLFVFCFFFSPLEKQEQKLIIWSMIYTQIPLLFFFFFGQELSLQYVKNNDILYGEAKP